MSVTLHTSTGCIKSTIFTCLLEYLEEALKADHVPLLTASDLSTVLCGFERDDWKFQAQNKETEMRQHNLDRPFSAIQVKNESLPALFKQVLMISIEQERQVDVN